MQSKRELVLTEIIRTARAIHPPPTHEIEEFGSYLAIATPDQYRAVEALFAKVRQFAAQADSVSQYTEASSAANSLLRGLDQTTPVGSSAIERAHPAGSGDAYTKFNKRFEGDRQRNRMIADQWTILVSRFLLITQMPGCVVRIASS